MHFFLLYCFCLNIAMFGAKVLASAENQSITLKFHFKDTGNCRLSRVALLDDKYGYDLVEHGAKILGTHLEGSSRKPMDVCVYENLLQQTNDPELLFITTSNETILRGTIRISDNMYNIKNYKLQLDENNRVTTVQQAIFHAAYGNQSTSFDEVSRRSRRSASSLQNQWPKYAQNEKDLSTFYLELYLAVDDRFCKQRCLDTQPDWCKQRCVVPESDRCEQRCVTPQSTWCEQQCVFDATEWNHCRDPCKKTVLEIMKRVHKYFRELNIYVVLVRLDFVAFATIHNQRTTRSASNIVPYFQQYVANNRPNLVYDVAHFISAYELSYKTEFGAAYPRTVCAKPEAFGVTVAPATTDIYNRSIAVANIIARSFNIDIDSESCQRFLSSAIMSVTDFSDKLVQPLWSYCSKRRIQSVLTSSAVYCLRNKPRFVTRLHEDVCGNGIVDAGEQCDDGKLNSQCCDMTSCQFKELAKCSSGACCDTSTCLLKSSGSECSTKKNDCDVAETCSGNSEWCPEDQHAPNKTPCHNNKGTCYQGQCGSRELACEMLYGSLATTGSDVCYDENAKSNPKNGFCDISWTDQAVTTPCSESDKMCGQLHCNVGNMQEFGWPLINLAFNYRLSTNQTNQCKRKYFHIKDDFRSPFMVPNGSPCPNNGICINSVCQTTTPTSQESTHGSDPSESSSTTQEALVGTPGNVDTRNPLEVSGETSENSDTSNTMEVLRQTLENSDSSNTLEVLEQTSGNSGGSFFEHIAPGNHDGSLNTTASSLASPLGVMPELSPELATSRKSIQMRTSMMLIGLLAFHYQYVLQICLT